MPITNNSEIGDELILENVGGNPGLPVVDGSQLTALPSHALGTAHSADTLANLNAKVSDATLIDTTDARLSDDRTADGIRTATTVVAVSAAAAPTAGQILEATNGTTATWQDNVGSDIGLKVVLVSATAATSYATITLALASASSGDTVYVGPGTYAESFTIPANVTVIGLPGRRRVTITGALTTGTRVTLNNGSALSEVTIVLPTDALPAIDSAVTTSAVVSGVNLAGAGASGIGVRHTGAGVLNITELVYGSGTCASLLSVSAGVVAVSTIVAQAGTFTDVALLTGGDITLSSMLIASSATVTDGVEIGNAAVTITNSRISSGTNGIHVTNSLANVRLIGVTISTNVTTHILVDAGASTASVIASGGELDPGSFSAPLAWGLQGFSFDPSVIAGDNSLDVHSELHVGSPDNPVESSFGGGDSYVFDMEVHQFDTSAVSGSKFTSVTAAARSSTGSTFAYPTGAAIGDAIYFAAPRKFPGIKITQTVLMTPAALTVVVWEYYNGTTWVAFNVCSANSNAPRLATANDVFDTNLVAQIRFDDSFLASWTAADNVLDSVPNYGASLFAVRARITGAAPTVAPTFEQSKIYPAGRTEINSDAVIETMGTSEGIERISFVQAIDYRKGQNNKPSTQDFSVSPSITLPGKDNLFDQDVLVELYMAPGVPSFTDTSRPLVVDVLMAPVGTAAGNYEMQLDVAIMNTPKTYDGLNAETSYSSVVASPAVAGREIVFSFSVDISALKPDGDIMFRLYRNAGVGSDTVVDDLALLRSDLSFVRYLS